jgi:S1-C subfamily serine protease
MDLLDAVLIVLAVGFGVSGYRQGFIVGILSFAGFFGGAILGAVYAPGLHQALGLHGHSAVFGLVVAFVSAALGQLAATALAVWLRRRLTWHPARVLDAVGGGAVGALSVLVVAWFVASAIVASSLSGLTREVNHSGVLTSIQRLMPDWAVTWDGSFRRLVERSGFPQVFGAIGAERITDVPPPDPRVASSLAVREDAGVIVKITGVARSCQRQLEGSGFLYAPQHVLTNAHVVAGVHHPTVSTIDGQTFAAQVVLYDPHRDVAVLYVPGLTRTPLRFASQAAQGKDAIVAGYPGNGPFRPVAARIRGVEVVRGPDIYEDRQVTRQIYSIYAVVRPGNSGGPLLAADGRVYGMVFADAADDPRTGYALTAREVRPDATAGAGATAAVSTLSCD